MLFAMEPALVAGLAITLAVLFGGLAFAVMAARRPSDIVVDSEALERDAARQQLLDSRRGVVDRVDRGETLPPFEDVTSVVGSQEEEEEEEEDLPAVYAPEVSAPIDPVEVGMARRQLLNRSLVTGTGVGLAALGGGALAFMIPPPSKGFGSTVTVGKPLDEVKRTAGEDGFFYVPEGKFYLVPYEPQDLDAAKETYSALWAGVEKTGLMALYQKCPHLGCRVPFCDSSSWFECPCHGSQYNKAGEKQGGPAPRGMDRFPLKVSGNKISVDTGALTLGPSIGTDTVSQPPEGPHCV